MKGDGDLGYKAKNYKLALWGKGGMAKTLTVCIWTSNILVNGTN